MIYRIAITNVSGNQDLKRADSRKRADAADLRASRMVYDLIRDHAGLGTPWGREAFDRALAACAQLFDGKGSDTELFQGYHLHLTVSRS